MKIQLIYNIFYTFLISSVLILMDSLYSLSNVYFIFDITLLEFFVKIFLLVLFISFIQSHIWRLSLLFIIIIFSFFQYVHFEYFGKNIQGIEYYLFFTNVVETFETLSSMLSMVGIPLIIVFISSIIIYLLEERLSSRLLTFKYSKGLFLIAIIAMNIYMYTLINIQQNKLTHRNTKWMYPMTHRHSARNFFISFNYFLFGILPQKMTLQSSVFPTLDKPILTHSDLNRTIILVIGESLRYDKFKLNTHNKLTPKLQELQKSGDIAFKKIYAGGTVTKVSVATLINRLKYPQGFTQISKETNCLYKLAKENNFETYFISRQVDEKLRILRDIMCPKYIDTFITRGDFSNYITPVGYDEDLKTMVKKLNIIQNNSFIVLQHRGSHSPYEKQYPKAFNHYTPYENSVLYTDTNLFEFITYLQKNIHKEFIFLYVSDHGELLGENGKNGHGHFEKEVYEVPMLMYTNSKDSTIHKDFSQIKSHYELSNFIVSLLGYKADTLEQNRIIYILNADIDGFSGYGSVDINHTKESPLRKHTKGR